MQKPVNEDSCFCLAADAGTPSPLETNHYFPGCSSQPVTGSQDRPLPALLKMTDGNDVQLQRHQKPLCNGEIYDSHLGPGRLRSSAGAGVLDRLQTVSEPRTESPQSQDKLPPLIFLAFDLESEAGSLRISAGNRSGTNVFPIEARSARASWFTRGLKW